MKKFIYLFALLAIVGFTSCGIDDDKGDTVQTFTATVNNRAIDGNDVVFSQTSVQVEVNFTQMTLQMSTDFKDSDGTTRSLSTTPMKLNSLSSSVCSFSGNSVSGYIDLSTGMMRYIIPVDNSSRVVCTTQIVMPYLTSTVTNENGGTYSHNQSGYIFAIDSKCEKAVMQITDYIPDTGGSVQASVLQYDGITVTPTADGYIFTASEATCVQSDFYNISDLHVTVTNDCMNVNGSFKIKNHTYTMSGKVFGDLNN